MTPTDEDLALLILKHHVMDQWPTQKQCNDFARDVLAKWGTPPAGEHAAQICESRARSLSRDGDHAAANEARKCASAIRANTAPPVREPLTPEQITGITGVPPDHHLRIVYEAVVRSTEQAHGIKGGSDARA